MQEKPETDETTLSCMGNVRVELQLVEVVHTSVVRQIDKKVGDASLCEAIHSGDGVRLELDEVAFKRAHKHLPLGSGIIPLREFYTHDASSVTGKDVRFDNAGRSIRLWDRGQVRTRQTNAFPRRGVDDVGHR